MEEIKSIYNRLMARLHSYVISKEHISPSVRFKVGVLLGTLIFSFTYQLIIAMLILFNFKISNFSISEIWLLSNSEGISLFWALLLLTPPIIAFALLITAHSIVASSIVFYVLECTLAFIFACKNEIFNHFEFGTLVTQLSGILFQSNGYPIGLITALISSTLVSICEYNTSLSTTRLGLTHSLLRFFILFYINQSINRESKKEIENKNKNKSEFLTKMSHELRTPLFGIIGCLEIMEKDIPKKGREDLKRARICSETLLHLINDMLDISKIESGHIKLQIEEINVDEFMTECMSLVASQATQKKIQLQYDITNSLKSFKGDRIRLKQIVTNLIMNAIKFTRERGEILFQMRYIQKFKKTKHRQGHYYSPTIFDDFKPSNQGFVEFIVKDNGIGMTKNEMERAFSKFGQGCSDKSEKYRGYGLGLVISKKLVRRMAGMIYAQSDGPNHGTTFCFLVPQQGDPQIKVKRVRKRRKSYEQKGLKIEIEGNPHVLAVEDNEINRMVLKRLLVDVGCRCTCAKDGLEAYNLVKSENDFQIILMDLEMPVLSGIRTVEKIRRENIDSAPIIALSAHTQEDRRSLALQSGMDDYLTKPVSKVTLKRILYKWLQKDRIKQNEEEEEEEEIGGGEVVELSSSDS